MPGGYVFEVGNAWITRRIHCIAGRIGTTSLENGSHGEEYLEETLAEFEIQITGEGQRVTLEAKDFRLTGYETPQWDDSVRTLRLRLATELNGVNLPVSVFYEARAGEDFARKWLEVEPCDLENWTIRRVTIEKMRFRELVEGVVPRPRYPDKYASSEDKVHSPPENVITDETCRNSGYASAALQYARTVALRENCYKLMLMTGSKLDSTLRFYERAGYNSRDKTAFVQWL
jgi:GNAT superfamily N-acetyltransferase